MKLSKRKRYVLKWNGPGSLSRNARRSNRAHLGKGTELVRDIAYFYECRYRGHGPCDEETFVSGNRPSAKQPQKSASKRNRR